MMARLEVLGAEEEWRARWAVRMGAVVSDAAGAVETPEPAPGPGQLELEVVATRVWAIGVADAPGMMLLAGGAEMQAVAQVMVVAAAAGALATKGRRASAREKPGGR